MILEGSAIGYFPALFFGACSVVALFQFSPRAAYLKLDPTGFTFCCLFRAHTIRWNQVQEFGVTNVSHNKMVGWNFIRTASLPQKEPSTLVAFNREFAGYEAALPDTYSYKARDLAEIMNELLKRYGNPPDSRGESVFDF